MMTHHEVVHGMTMNANADIAVPVSIWVYRSPIDALGNLQHDHKLFVESTDVSRMHNGSRPGNGEYRHGVW